MESSHERTSAIDQKKVSGSEKLSTIFPDKVIKASGGLEFIFDALLMTFFKY